MLVSVDHRSHMILQATDRTTHTDQPYFSTPFCVYVMIWFRCTTMHPCTSLRFDLAQLKPAPFTLTLQIVSKRMACKPVPIYKTAFSLLVLRISSVVRMVMSKLLPSMYPSSSYYDMLKDGSIPYTRVRNAVVSQAVAGMAAMICFVSVMAAAVRFAFVA